MQKKRKLSSILQKKYSKLKFFRMKSLFLIFLMFVIFIGLQSFFSQGSLNLDTDSDGLADIHENNLGSNVTDPTDVINRTISGSYFLFVDSNNDNISDVLFDVSSIRYNDIKNLDGTLYIDINFDDVWDYTYKKGKLTPIENSSEIPWIFIIAGVIIFIIVLIIIILFKLGILYIYEEEIVVEE